MLNRISLALLVALSLGGQAAAQSTINPAIPAPNAPLNSAPVRNNFSAAYTDISNIVKMFPGSAAPITPYAGQIWRDTTSGSSQPISVYDGAAWALLCTLNTSAHTCPAPASAANVAGTSPIHVAYSGSIATISFDFTVANSFLATQTMRSVLAGTTNTYDIGTSATVGAFRTVYAGTSFVGPIGTFTTSAAVGGCTIGASAFCVTGASVFNSAITYGGVTFANSVTGTGSIVGSISPVFVTPTLGAAVGTSLALGGCTLGANALCVTGTSTFNSAIVYGGVTFANSATGTGSLVGSISPVLTGHVTVEGVTATGATGTGAFVFATAPSVSSLTVTTAFTATGLVTNADLVNAATTVNGQTCTLGSPCTITATAASMTVGTTTVGSGTTTRILYDNAGVLGEYTITGTGTVVVMATAPTVAGGSFTGLTALAVRDTSAAFDVTIAATSGTTLTAGRTLTLSMGNVAHTLAFGTTANTITFPSTSSDTVGMLAVANAWTGNESHSGTELFTGGVPSLSNGNASVAASSTKGGLFTGKGSVSDVTIQNGAGSDVCTIATGTTTINCATLTLTNKLAGTQMATVADASGSASSTFGVMKCDGVTTTCASGVVTVAGASATSITIGTTTIASGATGKLLYDNAGVLGEKNWVVKVRTLSAGAYAETSGTIYVVMECVGGGGGGGGAQSSGSNVGQGGGGGSGSYSRVALTRAAATGQTVALGTAGTAGSSAAGNGGAGGASSVGSLCVANGGSGGGGAVGGGSGAAGSPGSAGTGDFTIVGNGGGAGSGHTDVNVQYPGSYGAGSFFGGATVQTAGIAAGAAGGGCGAGGGGGNSFANVGGDKAGGAGAAGCVVATEYILN